MSQSVDEFVATDLRNEILQNLTAIKSEAFALDNILNGAYEEHVTVIKIAANRAIELLNCCSTILYPVNLRTVGFDQMLELTCRTWSELSGAAMS